VPKSAIRKDSDGQFLLVVTSKSSPLGNRYYAERYPVQVVASDDVQSAVTGLYGNEYVITTSNNLWKRVCRFVCRTLHEVRAMKRKVYLQL
jgi:hypothetical protein